MPTLFVLGAGASNPYGFPLGSELRALICAADGENHPAVRAIAQDGDFTVDDIRRVTRPFRRSNINSIDAFLGRQPELVPAGRALIAAIICSREDPEKILSENNGDHWYRLLWNALTDNTITPRDLRQNLVAFVTFNYDRSLEYFLHQSTKATYPGLDDAAAYSHWSGFRLLHVYGSVGQFNFGDPMAAQVTRPYTPEIRPHDVGNAAAGINIIPEGRNDAEVFKEARKCFDWAERVYVLGFGFDRLNCDRLGFFRVLRDKLEKRKPLPDIVASVLGLTEAEIDRARRFLVEDHGNWDRFNSNCTMTLREAGFPD